jgi:L-ribulose-5-phosphate 4-epimerase
MRDRFADVRFEVCRYARKMWEAGLVAGSSGNVSARVADDANLMAITPTSIAYDDMTADQIAIVELSTRRTIDSREAPSYEMPMHVVIYQQRSDVAAIVHTHAPFVTTLSILRKPLPPMIDEMIVHFGGTIEVAEYAFTGTDDVGRNALAALGDRSGVILANHGNVCIGRDLAQALNLAVTMESAARAYVQALQAGEPVPLPRTAIDAGRILFEKRRQ